MANISKSKINISKIKIICFVVVGVLLIGAVGYFGYNKIKHPKAKASSMRQIYDYGQISLKACATYQSGYGGVWKVHGEFRRKSSYVKASRLISYRNGSPAYGSAPNDGWARSTVNYADINLSAYYGDKLGAAYFYNGKWQYTGVIAAPKYIGSC